MKALFSRFNRGNGRERELASLPALPQWPPQSKANEKQLDPSYPAANLKPAKNGAPELSLKTLPPIALDAAPGMVSPTRQHAPNHHQQGTSSTTATAVSSSNGHGGGGGSSSGHGSGGDVQKKVAFISPPPSATVLSHNDRDRTSSDAPSFMKKLDNARHHGARDGRASTMSGGPGASKTSLATSAHALPASLRPVTSPMQSSRTFHHHEAASLRSGSPYSQSSTRTAVPMAQSWSEGAEDDLVCNLGQRERTRQEVLWEIVASEERYVLELIKLKEVFIEALLHPHTGLPPIHPSSPEPDMDYYRREITPQVASVEHLPIASRFLSSRATSHATDSAAGAQLTPPHPLRSETPMIDGESFDTEEDDVARARSMEAAKHNHPRSPYGTAARSPVPPRKKIPNVPFPTRSHQSLPPPPRTNTLGTSTASLGRQAGPNGSAQRLLSESARQNASSPASRVFRKLHKKPNGGDVANGSIPPHSLPEDLRRCLEVLETGIIPGHHVLSEGLRKRYDEQYPLVRSLADVFIANSHILHEYATYVLHLERALQQVDDALSGAASAGKKPKNQDMADWMKLCKFMSQLEDIAAERSETGLAISLSKPFQRLLKYPLLFQNLLFHTDPSTFEYESTLLMVSEVETIVRSIEDEKIQKEERDKTRDVFARIDGLEKVKMLALPKPSRILVEERQAPLDANNGGDTSSPPSASRSAVRSKSSFKRLTEVLQPNSSGMGGKKDLWLVVFNDVVLRCQRTGTTVLPMSSTTSSSTTSRTISMPELQSSKPKFASNGRRQSTGKPRNLYKFIKIETWDIGEVQKPRAGIIDMGDITRTRALSNAAPGDVPATTPEEDEEEDEGAESDESDRKSKMSFSYWGADRVTLTTPRPKPGMPVSGKGRYGSSLQPGRRAQIPSSYTNRESSANAKFGTRLVSSPDSAAAGGSTSNRPAQRRQHAATATTASAAARRTPAPSSDEGGTTMRSTQTPIGRPAWNHNTRVPPVAGPATSATNGTPAGSVPPVAKRARTPSTTGQTPPRLISKTSTTASEDSGIGLYRQLVSADPTLGT